MNEQFEFKSAANGQISLDQAEGIVECFVAGIGNKDSVGDIVVTGAFAKSLTRRKPRVVWAHSWNDPIGKVLEMYEVPPGDPRLPAKMRNAGIGGLYAKVQFNLQSEKGKEAFASVAFFGEEQEWSIGYKTINGAFDPAQQANVLKEVELYEVSPVLHGANQLTGTISVKSEQKNHMMPIIAGMPMMGEQQQPRMIVIAAPEQEQEQDEPFNIFAEGLAQPLDADKVQKIQAELSERTGSKVDIVEATDSFIVFRRTTTDGKVSMYRVGYHTPDDYNTFMFGKPEAYSGNDNKPQIQQEIEVKPADASMVPMQPQQVPYRDDDQDEMNTMLGGQVGVGKSAYAHLIEIPQIHMVQAKSMLQPVFNYHKLSTTDSDNGIIVNGSISAQAIDALQNAVKAIGQTIGQSVGNLRTLAQSFNPFAIDGDNDGFAQDGTAFQRPYIPIKKPDMDLPEVGGKKRNSSELLDKPTIRTGKKPDKDPSLLQGQERQAALAAGELQPRTMDDISFLANRRPENEGLAKYWDMSEDGLRAEGQKLVAARRGQTGSAREATDGELFKISHEFARREAYKQQFGKDFVPPKRTESTGKETFDVRDVEIPNNLTRPGREFTGYNPFIERDKEKQRMAKLADEAIAEYVKNRSKRGFGSRGDVTPEQQSRIDAARRRGADLATGRGQILVDNVANLSDEDKDFIRENGIVAFMLEDRANGPLNEFDDTPADRIIDLLPEGDWSTDSGLQADAEDIFASYEEGFFGQLDREFADRVNPADLDTPKAKRDRQRAAGQGEMFDDFDSLSADEQDLILEQGRDMERGLASRNIDDYSDDAQSAYYEDRVNKQRVRELQDEFGWDRDEAEAALNNWYELDGVDADEFDREAGGDTNSAIYSAWETAQVEKENRSGFRSRGRDVREDVPGKYTEPLGKWWSSYDELSDSEKADIEQAYFERFPQSNRPGSRDYDPQIAQDYFEENPEKFGYAKDFRVEAITALANNGADFTQARNVTDYWMENDAIHEEYLKEADGDTLYAMALAYDNYIEAAADDYNERQRGFGSGYEPSGGSRSMDPAYFDGDRYENDEYYQMYDEELLQQVSDEPLEDLIDLNNSKIKGIEDGPFTEEELTKLYEDGDFETIADGLRDKYIYRYGDNIDDTVRERYDTRGLGSRGDATPEMRPSSELSDKEKAEVKKKLTKYTNENTVTGRELYELITGDRAPSEEELNAFVKEYDLEGPFNQIAVEDSYFEAFHDAVKDGNWDAIDAIVKDTDPNDFDTAFRAMPELHPDFADYGDAGDMGFGSRGSSQDGELDSYGFGKPVKINKNDDWEMSRFDEIDSQSQQDFVAELEAEDYFADGDYDDADKLSLAADEWNGRGLEKRERYTDEMLAELYELEDVADKNFTDVERNGTDFEGNAFSYVEELIKNPYSTDFSDYETARKRMDSIRSSLQKRILRREKDQDDANTLGEEDFGFGSRYNMEYDPAYDAPEFDDAEVQELYDEEVMDWASDATLEDFMDLNYPSKYRNETEPPFTEEELTKLFNDGNYEDIVAMLPDQIADRYGDTFTERAQERLMERGAYDGFGSRGDSGSRTVQDFENLGNKYGARTIEDMEPYERAETLGKAKAELTTAINEAENMLDGLDEDSPEWERLFNAQQEMDFSLGEIDDMMAEMVTEKDRLDNAQSEAARLTGEADDLVETRKGITRPSAEDLDELSFEDAHYEYTSLMDDINYLVDENNLSVDWSEEKQSEIEKALRDGDYGKAEDMLYDVTQEIWDAADDKYRTAEAEYDDYPFLDGDNGFASRGSSRFDTMETPYSSAIEAVHYDRDTRELHVAFKPGQTGGEARYYTYSDVSPDYFDNEISGSNSIGRVINDVKKNHDVEVTNPRTVDAINGRGEVASAPGKLGPWSTTRGSRTGAILAEGNDYYYTINPDGAGGYRASAYSKRSGSEVDRMGQYETLEAAKAWAGKDYATRTRATTSPSGRSEIQDIDVSRSAALYESYYDPNAKELVVTFKDKDGNASGSYIYEGVTADEANELASASSKGKIINRLKASKSVRRAGADDRMTRTPGAADEVGAGGYEAQVDSHWSKIGPEEQQRYFARAVDSAINAGTGTSADEITADAKARAYDDRQIAMMEMQAEELGMGYRKIDVGSSAALNRVEYDPDKRELRVEYRGRDGKGNGEFYVYQNVPQSVVDDIEASDSRGATLRRVRDDFEFRTEPAIPESAFYSMGDASDNGRRNGRDGFASGGRLGPAPDDAEYARELAAQRARDRAAGRNATNPIGNRESEAEGLASRGSINESSTGQRIVPSRMHSDDREALAEITDPEERKQRIDELIEFYGPRIFAKPSKPKRKPSDYDEDGFLIENDGFGSRGGTSKLDRGYPYYIDVEKPLDGDTSFGGTIQRVDFSTFTDNPEYEPSLMITPWKSLSESRKKLMSDSILKDNREYFDKMWQDGASLGEIEKEIGKLHDEKAKAKLISLERTLKMAKEDFYESARRRLEKANPSMSQNEIDDMLVDMGLSETDFDNLFRKNMDAFELASVATDLEKKRREIAAISTPKTGGDRPKVDPLSILGGYSDGDVFGLTPRGFASRGESGVKRKTKEDVFADMQKQLIAALEDSENLGKWKLPWRRTGMPENGATGKKYSGSNWFFLSVMSDLKGYDSNKWATYNQWQGLGGQVRKGEKGTQIFVPMFVKGKEKADGTMGEGRIIFKAATVFNLKQIDGMPADFDKKEILPEAERVSDLEKTISEIPAVIKNGGDRAFFQPSGDFIQVPNFENFNDARSYYSTVAHELMHWTGGKGRLDRGQMGAFGTPEYAYEELVAEIASAIFMSSHDIEPDIQENHGPYLASWLKALKQDPDALQRAMTDAQKAVNYVLDISPNAKSKFSHGEKAEFDTPEIAVVGDPVVAVEGFASRGDWPTPGGYEPSEFDMRTALSQIGRGNLMAISGTRAKKRNNEMVLPVNRNQQVIVGYDGGSDTYFVRAEQIITNGKDKGKTRVLGQWDNVYADELGETAYQASLKPSMLSDENKTVWAQAFDHPQTGSLLDENGQVYENGFASGGDSMDPDELDAMDWAYDAAQDYLMEQEDMMPDEPSPEDGFASRMNLSTPEKNEIISIARGMDTPFTRSVVAQYDRNGELSDRQWDALNRMTLRGNRRGFPSRGDEKRPRAPKAPWSPEDRQRFADRDRLRSKKRPGKRRNGPDASEYGFGSRGSDGRPSIDMIESDIFFEGERNGRSWGFEPIISIVAEQFGGRKNMSNRQLAKELGVSEAVAEKMRKPGARTSDIYLLDDLRVRVAGADRSIWGPNNDPLAYYDESGKPITDADKIPDVEDLAPDAPGTRAPKEGGARTYIDPTAVFEEVGIDANASKYSIVRDNSDVFNRRVWDRIMTRGITEDEINALLKARKSRKRSADIYTPEQLGAVKQKRTDSMPLADIFKNQAFDSVRGKRGFPQQVAEAITEITGRRPAISTVKAFINQPRSSGSQTGRNPFSMSPAQIRLLLDNLGISAEEFDKFRSE